MLRLINTVKVSSVVIFWHLMH